MHKILLTLIAILPVFISAKSAETVHVENRLPAQEVQSVYPNPFVNTLFVKLTSAAISEIHIKVFDILGNEVYSNASEPDKVSRIIQLDLDTEKVSKRGVYIVKVEIDGQASLYRLFKD
jgi:hypothetical protein